MDKKKREQLIDEIIYQLKDNYSKKDYQIIENFVNRYILIASHKSGRSVNDENLYPYVCNAVVMAYLRTGKEASSSNSEGNLSDIFIDIEDKLKKDAISIRVLS